MKSTVVRLGRLLGFASFYCWEVLLANLRVASDILRPRPRIRPGIVAVPLGELTDRQLLLLSNLLTMTPGTLSLDLATDRRTLYIHAMYLENAEQLRREIRKHFETRIKTLF